MKTEQEKQLEAIAAAITIVTLVISLLWMPYVLSILWAWFVVPVFALPVLTWSQWIGLRVFVSALAGSVWSPEPNKDNSGEKFARAVLNFGAAVFAPPMLLLIGAIVRAAV